jgi:hypothetical protein
MDRRDLYGLPLERFTDERNALARRLRQEGEREQAAEVAKLRKPTVAAWAVNQLVRTQKRDFNALLKAGDALQRAQAALLSGKGDPAALRDAADAERTARDGLTAKARGLLSTEGHELQPAKLEQVSDTLQAAAIDDQARAEVGEGCLVRELRHAGLGAFGVGVGAAATSGSRGPSRRRAADQPDVKVKTAERADELKAARAAETAAGRQLERAQRQLRVAEERHERIASELRDAEQALDTASELADEAEREHQRAERALEEL